MKHLKFLFLSAACVFIFSGFTWPNEKQNQSPKAETAPKKAEASHEAPVIRGSDLMEGVVAALDLEGKPAMVTLQFTSGQKTGVEIDKDTTVFGKGESLGVKGLVVGGRVRVEYFTASGIKTAKNIEIVEVAPPAAVKADASEKKAPLKKSAILESKPASAVSTESEKMDKKLDE